MVISGYGQVKQMRWFLQTNQDAQIMEGVSNKVEQIGTSVNSETRGRYEIGKIGAGKTWYGSPHAIAKGGLNKGRSYTISYAHGEDNNTTAER